MLRWRLLSSFVLVSLLATAAYFDWHWGQPNSLAMPGIMALILLSLFAALAAIEFSLLTLPGLGGLPRHQAVMVFGTVLVVVSCCINSVLPSSWQAADGGGRWLLASLISGGVLSMGLEMLYFGRTEKPEPAHHVLGRIAATALAMGYVGIPLGVLGLLRQTPSNSFGLWALLTVLAIPKISDSGAFFVGRSLGRHKLIPRLSPGKTVEGAIGGFVFGVLGSLLMCYGIAPALFGLPVPLKLPLVIGYGLWIALAGMLGDLAESMFKRDARIKDSGGWLPGLGGMLDVVDSVLAASLAAYLFWQIVPVVAPNTTIP
ncbi:MAG: phosphatidate cytidylyltransferase [Planctomycetaceae bacterium]|nr:phosphatidate cytidylyltransferase [Planctomycetaceae bacterium]